MQGKRTLSVQVISQTNKTAKHYPNIFAIINRKIKKYLEVIYTFEIV